MRHFRVTLLLCMSAFFVAPAVAQNADTPKPKQAVATVGDQTIYDTDLASSAEGQLQPLRSQEFQIKRKALDSLIEQRLLENAAKAKGLTTDQLLKQEVDAKVKNPNDDQIQGFYWAAQSGGKLNKPLDDTLKAQLRESIKQSQTR